jgi:hypothetical protein
MDRPGYITHCPHCHQRIIVVDTYNGSIWDEKNKIWLTRFFDPDWVLSRHIEKNHK